MYIIWKYKSNIFLPELYLVFKKKEMRQNFTSLLLSKHWSWKLSTLLCVKEYVENILEIISNKNLLMEKSLFKVIIINIDSVGANLIHRFEVEEFCMALMNSYVQF